MTAAGIVLLATGRGTVNLVIGVLVLAFCTTSLTGYILGSIFVRRGAQVARFQNDYLSLVSHELRTPLTSISMFLETLRDERLTDPAEKQQCLDLMGREVRRLDNLLGRLLHLSRVQARGHRFDSTPVRLSDVVDDALSAFAGITLTDEVAVDTEIDRDAPLMVRGDREALGQAVGNLLVNAWKYTPKDKRLIRLVVKASERHVEISVIDNGPGISREEQQVIFDQFERGVAAESDGRGSGLGLAIVRAVARAHRGRVELHSQPGQGAEFCIRLPRFKVSP